MTLRAFTGMWIAAHLLLLPHAASADFDTGRKRQPSLKVEAGCGLNPGSTGSGIRLTAAGYSAPDFADADENGVPDCIEDGQHGSSPLDEDGGENSALDEDCMEESWDCQEDSGNWDGEYWLPFEEIIESDLPMNEI